MADITVSGMQQLGERLKELPAAIRDNVAKDAVHEAAKVGLAAIQTETPIRTGAMLRHETIGKRRGAVATQITYIVFVKTAGKRARGGSGSRGIAHGPSQPSGDENPYYWFFVEFGTSRMAANPFMLRGFTKSAANAATTARDIAASRLKDVVQ